MRLALLIIFLFASGYSTTQCFVALFNVFDILLIVELIALPFTCKNIAYVIVYSAELF